MKKNCVFTITTAMAIIAVFTSCVKENQSVSEAPVSSASGETETLTLGDIEYTPDANAEDNALYKTVQLSSEKCGDFEFVLTADALNNSEDAYTVKMKLSVRKDGKTLSDDFVSAHSDGSQYGTKLYKNDDPSSILKTYMMIYDGKEYPLAIVTYKCSEDYVPKAETLSRFFTVSDDKGVSFTDGGIINYPNLSDKCKVEGNKLIDGDKTIEFDFNDITATVS